MFMRLFHGPHTCWSAVDRKPLARYSRERLLLLTLKLNYQGVAYPINPLLCGEPAPVSVTVIVPERLVPFGAPRLVNLTETEQLAPGATAAPVQVSGPAKAPLVNR